MFFHLFWSLTGNKEASALNWGLNLVLCLLVNWFSQEMSQKAVWQGVALRFPCSRTHFICSRTNPVELNLTNIYRADISHLNPSPPLSSLFKPFTPRIESRLVSKILRTVSNPIETTRNGIENVWSETQVEKRQTFQSIFAQETFNSISTPSPRR